MMIKKVVVILIVVLLSFSCSSKKEGPFHITSVKKDLPKGKIKLIKKGGTIASMTHKTFLQRGSNEKHQLKDCSLIKLTFEKYAHGIIHVDAVHKECSESKEIKRENYKITFKKPCVFRFETIMILVVKVDEDEIHYRIIRDRG